jgi:hypothetical protein
MNQVVQKPSERVVQTSIDGKEVVDSLGRKIVLRKPDILDMWDVFSAIGAEDSKNPACMMLATKVLHIATIDGQVVMCPKSQKEFRAALKRIGESGILAIDSALDEIEQNLSQKEMIEKAKK